MKKEVLVLLFLVLSLPLASAVDIKEVFTIQKDSVQENNALTSNLGKTSYFYAGSKLIASKDSDNNIEYHHQDRLGSDINSRQLPFGQELVDSGNRFEFTGKELDDKSGLNYFGARYYDSNLGRFSGVDPVSGQPPYQYVANNPMNYIDPDGRKIHLGQYYLMDTGIGDSQLLQYSPAYSDAPWYNFLEHTAVLLNNLGGAVFTTATTVLAIPDVGLAALGADESDREGIYLSAMMIGWEYQMLQQATRASSVFNRRLIMGENLGFVGESSINVNNLEGFGRALSLNAAEEASLLQGRIVSRSISLSSEGTSFYLEAQMYVDSEGYHMGLYSLVGTETNSATALTKLNKQIHAVAQTTARNLGFDSYCINNQQVSNQKIAEMALRRGGQSVGPTETLVLPEADASQGLRAGENTLYSDIQTRYKIPEAAN